MNQLDAIIASPSACYLFVGHQTSAKLAAAEFVSKGLNCTSFDTLRLKPNEKGSITIEMAHEVVSSLTKRSNRSDGHRIVIIESAERMTTQAQNALLKVIEEPPTGTIFILLVSSKKGVLATIASRCQVVYIRPTEEEIDPVIKHRVEEIISAGPMERIKLVDDLAKRPDLAAIIDYLAASVSKSARMQNATSQSLQSMQNYFIYSSAGVASKHALTEMMIQL